MKSSTEQLRQRGFAPEGEELKYTESGEQVVMKLLSDRDAYKRTIGIRLISKNKKEKYLPLLCKMLEKENKLYTKIALCECLEEYGETAIPYLIPLLGTIGDNQHKEIKIADLDKKSYPLPRDIAARVLIRIGPGVFPGLRKILKDNKNRDRISEAIDVIGHVTWNFHDCSMEDVLVDFYYKNIQDEFLVWKLIRSFQSFHSKQIKDILEDTVKNHGHEVIVKEAKRSLDRIKSNSEN